jgi:hypothetical protein
MSNGTVQVSRETDIGETTKDDILSHSNHLTYEARFVIASSVDYDYLVTCDEFPTVCKDAAYIGRSIIQAKFENRHPSTAKDSFPTPQPFKYSRVPKDQNPQSAA